MDVVPGMGAAVLFSANEGARGYRAGLHVEARNPETGNLSKIGQGARVDRGRPRNPHPG